MPSSIDSNGNDKYLDSILSIHFDTTNIDDYVKKVVNDFNVRNYPFIQAEQYKRMDLNFDGIDDLIIFYSANGTGPRILVQVYKYDKHLKRFNLDTHLSKLENPSFYIKQKMITGFYLGHGGGYGVKFNWINNQWDTTLFLEFTPYSENKLPMWKVSKIINMDTIIEYSEVFVIPPYRLLPNDFVVRNSSPKDKRP